MGVHTGDSITVAPAEIAALEQPYIPHAIAGHQ